MSDSNYFDLHTQGIGYLNRVRKVTPKNGSDFWACDISALHGSVDNVNYTRFDCRVSGATAKELISQYVNVTDDHKVLIGFRLGDLYAEAFTYSKGDRAGETGISLKARVIYVGFIKFDGETVYSADPDAETAPEEEPQDRETDTGPVTQSEATTPESVDTDPDSMPAEVALSKDDPDFMERKRALKEAGYKFDGQAKVWRLPEAA